MTDESKVDAADAIVKGLEQLADDNISMSILDWTVFSHACLGAAAAMRETRRLTIKYHGLGMKDPAHWRVGLEEIASIVAEDQSHDQN